MKINLLPLPESLSPWPAVSPHSSSFRIQYLWVACMLNLVYKTKRG